MFKRTLIALSLTMIFGVVMILGVSADTRGSTCGTVTYEYGSPGDLRWVEDVTISVYRENGSLLFINVVETDANGRWCLESQLPFGGPYTIRIRANDTLHATATDVYAFDEPHAGTLLEGNVDGSDTIDSIDRDSIRNSYGKTGVQQDDLDEDGLVGLSDISLLRKNFGQSDAP